MFARLLYEAGADTLEGLCKRSPEELFEQLHAINDDNKYTQVMASLKDVAHRIETARELPKVIEYE